MTSKYSQMAVLANVQFSRRGFTGMLRVQDIGPVLVNFLGLLVAFGAVGLCILTISSELSYDSWIRDHDKAYQIQLTISPPGGTPVTMQAVNARLADALVSTPLVRESTRLSRENLSIKLGERSYSEVAQVVDDNFLSAFGIPLTANSLPDPLSGPGRIVLSELAARKYFGDRDPVGESLQLANGTPLQVTGVLAPLPGKTHLPLNILVSSSTLSTRLHQQSSLARPDDAMAYTYFWLKAGETRDRIEAALPDLLARTPAFPPEETITLQPSLGIVAVTDIHRSGLGELKPGGSPTMLVVMAAVATILVVITCVNFSIFVIARTARRTLEYGVKRSFGASRFQIILAGLAEAVVTTVLAMAIASAFIAALMPLLPNGSDSSYNITLTEGLLLLLPPAIVACGASAASAFLSGGIAWMSPAGALRRQRGHSGNIAWGAAIAVQFWLTTTILVLTIVVALQTNFAIHSSLPAGSGSDIFIIDGGIDNGPTTSVMQTARTEIGRIPGVRSVAQSAIVPTNFTTSITGFYNQDIGQTSQSSLLVNDVDAEFFTTYSLMSLAGRVFTEAEGTLTERNVLVVSHAALSLLGFRGADEAVGARIMMASPNGSLPHNIIGVVQDITMKSVEHPIEPLVFRPVNNSGRFLSVRIGEGDRQVIAKQIDRVWKDITGQELMSGSFLDERLQELYHPLEKARIFLLVMGLVSTAIACLGIYALASLVSVRQRHEIGLRRALGASQLNIVTYVTARFLFPVLTGLALAAPVAALISHYWLSSYSNRIELTAWPFIFASALVFSAGALAIIQHVAGLARVKPNEALRG